MEDTEIVDLMRRGDERGIQIMLATHGRKAKGWLGRRFGLAAGDHALDDAVNDAALIMFKQGVAEQLDADRNLYGYLLSTAKHELIRRLKERDGGYETCDWLDETIEAPTVQDPDDPGSETPFETALREFIETGLAPQERAILKLLAESDFKMSGNEIAKRLKTSRHAIEVARNRAKAKLEEFLRNWRQSRTPDHGASQLNTDLEEL